MIGSYIWQPRHSKQAERMFWSGAPQPPTCVEQPDDPLLEVLIGSMTVSQPARRQLTDPACRRLLMSCGCCRRCCQASVALPPPPQPCCRCVVSPRGYPGWRRTPRCPRRQVLVGDDGGAGGGRCGGRTVRGLVFQHLAGSIPLPVEPGVGRARTRQCPRCSRTQSSGCPRNEGRGRTPRTQLLGDLEQNAILRPLATGLVAGRGAPAMRRGLRR